MDLQMLKEIQNKKWWPANSGGSFDDFGSSSIIQSTEPDQDKTPSYTLGYWYQ